MRSVEALARLSMGLPFLVVGLPPTAHQTGTESWHVLADPEGSKFCLPGSVPSDHVRPGTEPAEPV
jgi:hypothetical protein